VARSLAQAYLVLGAGRARAHDRQPLILANSKARKAGQSAGRQKAFKEIKRPYVEALIFCSDPSISIQLAESERMRVCARLPLDKAPGIIPALLRRESPGITPLAGTVIDKPVARAIVQAWSRRASATRSGNAVATTS